MVSGYAPGACRTYEVAPGLLDRAMSRLDLPTYEASTERLVIDLFTGEPFNARHPVPATRTLGSLHRSGFVKPRAALSSAHSTAMLWIFTSVPSENGMSRPMVPRR